MQKTVLFIEDEPEIQSSMSIILTQKGYKVELASNGAEGLERIKELEPNVIICDRAMPVMSGYELLKELRKFDKKYRDIPFIFLTGLNDLRDKGAVKDMEPHAYLEKPIDFNLLDETLKRAISHT